MRRAVIRPDQGTSLLLVRDSAGIFATMPPAYLRTEKYRTVQTWLSSEQAQSVLIRHESRFV